MDIKIQFDLYSMDCDTAEIKRNGERCYVVISLIAIYEMFRGRLDSEAISIIHIVHRGNVGSSRQTSQAGAADAAKWRMRVARGRN